MKEVCGRESEREKEGQMAKFSRINCEYRIIFLIYTADEIKAAKSDYFSSMHPLILNLTKRKHRSKHFKLSRWTSITPN